MPRPILVLFLLVGALLIAPASFSAEPWDQVRISELASKLADEVKAIDKLMTRSQLGNQQRRDFFRLRETVRRIRNETKRLASLLDGGAGHDETVPVFEQLGLQVRNAREISRRMMTTSDLQQKFDAARAVLDEIAPYYDVAPRQPSL